MITLKELQVLVQVSEMGGVTNVAASLGIAQSAISRQIAELEAKIGGALFHRTGRGLVATDLAATLLPKAKSLLAEAQQLSDDAKQRAGVPSGNVSVGLVSGVAAPLAGKLVNRLRAAFPDIHVNIYEGFSGEVDSWLASARIDVGVLNRYRSARQMRYQALFQTDILLIGAPGSRYLKAKEIDFATLGEVPIVETTTPNNLTGLFAELARRQGVTRRIEVRSDSASVVRDLIANCGLHATMPYHAVAAELAAGRLRAARIVNPSIRQKVVLATSTHRPPSVATRQVAKVLLELGKALAPG